MGMAMKSSANSKTSLVWMVIVGDGLHNLIDGLSLGAALADSHLTGFSIAIAILFEEIPHELGDFAILIASGMSPRRAAAYNFMSASTCYLGMVIGLYVGDISDTYSTLVFAVAAGMFLYISLFNIMVELNDRFNEARVSDEDGIKNALITLIAQNIGICVGVSCLYHLAKFDERALANLIETLSWRQ